MKTKREIRTVFTVEFSERDFRFLVKTLEDFCIYKIENKVPHKHLSELLEELTEYC